MPQLVWTCDAAGVVDYYNTRLADYVAVKRTTGGGWTWQPLIHPDEVVATLARWQQSMGSGEPYEIEHRLRMHDGRYCWHLSRARAAYDDHGQIVKWFGTATDIDSNKRIELNAQFLVELDAELNRLTAPEEIEQATIDRVGRYLEVERCYFVVSEDHRAIVRREWRRNGASLLGKYDIKEFITPEARAEQRIGHALVVNDVASDARTRAALTNYTAMGIGAFVAAPVIHQTRLLGTLNIVSSAPRAWHKDEAQLLREVAARVWPLVERARAVAAVRASEEGLQAALEGGQMGVWAWDPANNVSTRDRRVMELFGVDPNDVAGDSAPIFERIHPDDLAGVEAALAAARQPGGEYRAEFRVLLPDGQVRWLAGAGRARFDAEGQATLVYGVNFDITARKQDEADSVFLAELAERIRLADDPDALLVEATELTGLYLQLSRCYLSEADEGRDCWWVERDFHADLPSVAGEYRISDYPTFTVADLRAGRMLIATDTQTDPRSADFYAAAYAPVGIRAHVVAPLMRDGHWVASLTAAVNQPRQWQPREIELLATIAERVWLAVERLRAERQLRRSHDTFLNLIEGAPFGIYLVDAQFRLAQVGAGAQQVFSNIRPLLGRDFNEVLRLIWPEPFASEAIALFRHTLETGEPYRAPTTIEQRHDINVLESYDWRIERVTLPDGQYGVVCYFYDLSERRQAEADARFLADISEHIRLAEDAPSLLWETVRVIGAHLQVDHAFFTEVEKGQARFEIHRDYHTGDRSFAGSYERSAFGPALIKELVAGHVAVVRDVAADPRLTESLASYKQFGIGASVAVPLLRDERQVSSLVVTTQGARDWTLREITLLETIAERVWNAVEKLRLDALLRRQAQLIELSHESVMVWDLDDGILDCNRGCEELYGYTRLEVFGRQAHEVLGTVFPGTFEEMRELLLRHGSWRGELRHRTRDGREITVESRWQLFESGNQRLVLEVNRDITARKQSEAALQESEARFRQMADVTPQFIWVSQAEGQLEYINERWLEYSGLDLAATADPAQLAALIHPNDRDRLFDQWAQSIATGAEYQVEARIQNRHGEFRWFLIRTVPQRDQAGRIVNWFGASTDIQEQKQNELDTRMLAALTERLRVSESADELMREVAATLGRHLQVDHCFFTTVDTARDRVTIYPGYGGHSRVGAMPTGEYPFSPLSPVTREAAGAGETLIVPDTTADARTRGVTAYQQMGLGAFVTAPRLRDGQLIAGLTVSTVAQREWTAHEAALVELVAERSWLALEKLQAEAERELLFASEQAARQRAEEATRLKDEFLATVSHELRAPLNAISGWMNLLRGGGLDAAATERAMETITRNAAAQGLLIEDLLDVSRIVTGKMKMEMTRVDLGQVIEAALDTVRPSAEVKQIVLQVSPTDEAAFDGLSLEIGAAHAVGHTRPSEVFVQGDATRLQQAIWNLLVNAVKFTPEGGHITIAVNRTKIDAPAEPRAGRNEFVEITVRDTGRGIAPEFLPYVFDRFRQAESTMTRKMGGLGLGLAIVRHIVEAHGGEVRRAERGRRPRGGIHHAPSASRRCAHD